MTRRKVAHWLDNWKPWMVIAYFALALAIVFLFILAGRTARADAERIAERRAGNSAQVTQCYASAKSGPAAEGTLAVLDAVITNSIITTRAALDLQPDSPLSAARRRSLKRLTSRRASIGVLRDQVQTATPALKECRALARRLRVPQPKETTP